MATIKSYTDIEQSKILAEILPLESADMCYIKHSSSDNPTWEFNEDFPPMILGDIPINEITAETLPCWSLAALLEQLDEEITDKDGNDYVLNIFKEALNYQLSYHDPSGTVEDIETNFYDYMIDACYEMILKLKKRNLL